MPDQSFDIDLIFERLRTFAADLPKAEMFALYDLGYTTVFQQLVACILSIRTRDEVSGPAAIRLFELAKTPADMAACSPEAIYERIATVGFAPGKARQIHAIAVRTVTEFGEDLPADFDVLTALNGVGPKCANLALGVASNIPGIAVDVHVHRITNRWGYVSASTPEKTLVQLEAKLPREYWVEINERLVPLGKKICPSRNPKCGQCPVQDMCARVGVEPI